MIVVVLERRKDIISYTWKFGNHAISCFANFAATGSQQSIPINYDNLRNLG